MQNHYAEAFIAAAGMLFSVLLVVNMLLRMLPESFVARLEKSAPRAANTMRFLRAVGPDLDKALRVLFALVTGKEWVQPKAFDKKDDNDKRPPPASPSTGLLALCVLLVSFSALASCAASPHQVASVAVASAGSLTQQIHREHQRTYRQATDALRGRLNLEHGTLADYDAQVRPLDEEFTRRGDAIDALAASLYAAAAIVDATRSGAGHEQYAAAARECVAAIDAALVALSSSGALPPIQIPSELSTTRETLRGIAGAR